MTKSTITLVILMAALVCAGSVTGQNFSVSIDAKGIFADPYFYPKQRGESFQFKVNVKNKTENTQTISIDKEATFPYPVHNWVSIANLHLFTQNPII
ncbi:hypothetical protein BY457_10234 [Marinilabilia salmonicolor]|uniref:hypothetical protein n=1 Tax=Marinilabilia salmonicolor TaxID=989 RepID=UPI000D4A1152|nr:hypothetical protein [Marinilabilia salmonicolor]PRZ01633.1 hypothetical protein BY457_10234 [Marinilabilia salmonicolor]